MSYFECFSVTIILRCNLTKSDETTFFILNVDLFFVRNWVLHYINENAKHSAESIPNLYVHFSLSFPVTSGSFENEALENEDRSTKHPKLENEAP